MIGHEAIWIERTSGVVEVRVATSVEATEFASAQVVEVHVLRRARNERGCVRQHPRLPANPSSSAAMLAGATVGERTLCGRGVDGAGVLVCTARGTPPK